MGARRFSLRVLEAVGRLGSVTKADEELHYSQPTVSHHLARLEAETGAQLLQRVGRGVRLTEAGRLLAARAAISTGRVDEPCRAFPPTKRRTR